MFDIADEEGELVTQVKCPKSYKSFFTVIKKVKKAHEINDYGENQVSFQKVQYFCLKLKSWWMYKTLFSLYIYFWGISFKTTTYTYQYEKKIFLKIQFKKSSDV